MIERPFWIEKLTSAWQKRSIIWLAGVRRVGKTTLARMLSGSSYLNCDLPSTLRKVEDPELFFRHFPEGAVVIFDEIHRLPDPSQTLKIAADEFSQLRILATGSSTLAAGRKFRDTLTGRKVVLFFPPVLYTESQHVFGVNDLDKRLLHGGLPECLLADDMDGDFYAEWLDSFYARDIQELFGIRERTGFLNLLRLMLRQSSGLVDYSSLSRECDLSRPTVKAHLEAMAVSCALYPVQPFHGGGRREIIKRPRVYAFDTGFVAFARGWDRIREDDRGLLWEHLVLDTLRVSTGGNGLFYWRDKSGREVDFVVAGPGKQVHAIECKINPDYFDPEPLRVFRQAYPDGRNYVICPAVEESYQRQSGGLTIQVGGCRTLLEEFGKRNNTTSVQDLS